MEPTYFPDPMTDRLLAVCMTLATETWVSRQRIERLEARLAQASVPEAPEPHSPAANPEALEAFVAQLMAALDGQLASKRLGPEQLQTLLRGGVAHE
jgi:hypothetical protein